MLWSLCYHWASVLARKAELNPPYAATAQKLMKLTFIEYSQEFEEAVEQVRAMWIKSSTVADQAFIQRLEDRLLFWQGLKTGLIYNLYLSW
jgi:hypothetical protein